MQVPFVDLHKQYLSIKNEIDGAIEDVIKNTAFIKGKYVQEFENNFAEKYGVKHCIGVANGTDAIFITLKMLGIGNGDEVITVANSWISTSETISNTGAIPVFVDIEPDYYSIDVSRIEEKITSKTRAIIPVHLYGQPADIKIIQQICEKYNLFLIEDCAQAHFSKFENKFVGTYGDVATFSFYPGKNLGAFGDAGCIITDNDQLAEKCRMYANHGALTKHQHIIEGVNSRLDGLQAAIINAKLPYIDSWNEKRLQNALYYNELLKDLPGIVTPKIKNNCKHIFHLYVIRSKKRDEISEFLNQNGVQTAIHYPTALPFMQAYKYLQYEESDLPIAFQFQKEILSLPMYPELAKEQIEYVVKLIRKITNNG